MLLSDLTIYYRHNLYGILCQISVTSLYFLLTYSFLAFLSICSKGSAPRYFRLLFGSFGRWGLRGFAGGGVPAARSATGSGSGCLLQDGTPPPAGLVLHPIQSCRLQEPACITSSRPGGLLWPAGGRRERGKGKRVGLSSLMKPGEFNVNSYSNRSQYRTQIQYQTDVNTSSAMFTAVLIN